MIAIFEARLWDEAEPLDPALVPDHCHGCHRSVARLAGLLTRGPCIVLCPDCWPRRGTLRRRWQVRLLAAELRPVLVVLAATLLTLAALAGIIGAVLALIRAGS